MPKVCKKEEQGLKTQAKTAKRIFAGGAIFNYSTSTTILYWLRRAMLRSQEHLPTFDFRDEARYNVTIKFQFFNQ